MNAWVTPRQNPTDMTSIENLISDEERDILEPYNPDYLLKEAYAIPELSSYEKRFCRKVGTLHAKLRRAKIYAHWDPHYEVFEVRKTNPKSGYDWVMYVSVDMDTNSYAFGGETEDICVSGRVSEVVAAVVEWMSNDEKPSCK